MDIELKHDESSGQLLAPGLHDARLIGILHQFQGRVTLTFLSVSRSTVVLNIVCENEIFFIGEGVILPMVINVAILKTTKDFLANQSIQVSRIQKMKDYSGREGWILEFIASYGDGLLVFGSGPFPKFGWENV